MIEKPNATYSEDFYRFHWPDMGIEAIVERLKEETTDIRCELTVNSAHSIYGGRLYTGKLLLMGPNSRRDVGRLLAERQDEIDWPGLLDHICMLARDRFRAGEPVLDLLAVPSAGVAKWVIEPFVVANGLSILYGDGATAKSCIALWLGLRISLNLGPVLVLDWEDGPATHAERLRAEMAGMDIEDVGAGIFYQRRAARLADSVRDIRRIIAEKGIVFVVVDSMGMAAGDPNNHDLMIECVRACRQLGIAVLGIHHLPKNALDKTKPFGSVYASNEARLTWLVEKAQEDEANEFTVLLTHTKSNGSKYYGKRALRLAFENEGDELVELSIAPVEVAEVPAFLPKLALWQHLRHVLNGQKLGVPEIKAVMEADGRTVSEGSIRRAISEHRLMFVNVGGSKPAVWGLRNETGASHEGIGANAR